LSKLWKVCDIIRKELGLDRLTFAYSIRTTEGYAGTAQIFDANWAGMISFYPDFFSTYASFQFGVIVHEHLHVALMPLDQVARKGRDYHKILEHTQDNLVPSLCRLLRPKVRPIWDTRTPLTKPRRIHYEPR
jgi:hypothetical protein